MRISCLQYLHSPLRTFLFAALLYLLAPASAQAQSQSGTTTSPYLFASIPTGSASQVAAFSVDSSGALKAVPGSPFDESRRGGFVAVDPLNQFVFVLNATAPDNSISVFSIDSATGALAELTAAGSPFAAPGPPNGGAPPSSPLAIAAFKTTNGNEYLYVAYRNGLAAFTGAIAEFQIGTATQPLTPIATTSTDGTPVDIAISPQGYLYAALQVVLGSAATPPSPTPGVAVFAIDPDSGALTPSTFANSNLDEDSVAMTPAGNFLFDGAGSPAASSVESAAIQSDGSTEAPAGVTLGSGSQPTSMLVDGTGHFLYVREGTQTVVYPIDPTTGDLSAGVPVPQLPLSPGNTVADPVEPYLYSLQSGQLQVLRIDPSSGALAQISHLNVDDGGGAGGLAITNSAAPTVPGPSAGFAPPALNFQPTPVTQPSPPELMHLTNTGTQPLDVNLSSIAISGVDASEFALTQSCATPLLSHATCTISIVFTPSVAAARQATLTVNDSAGTQTALLSGTGLGAEPAVTLAPSATLTFAPTNLGSIAATQSVVLTNSGDAALHISSILAGGVNSGDFAVLASPPPAAGAPPACSATTPYSPNASCSINIVFTPLGAGARSASIIIADDAPGSTQTVLLSGTGLGAPVPRPAAMLSATSLAFTSPAISQKSTPQSVTISSSGTSPLTISSVLINGPNAPDFSLTSDGCTAPSYAAPNGCTLSIAFTPSASGSRIAVLVIADNDPSATQTVSLSGMTQPPEALTITASNGVQQTVTAGQTATFQFQIASTFSGTVNFSPCTGGPANSTCTVQPAQMSLTSGQAPVAFSITVATVAASAALREKLDGRRPFAPIAIAQIFLVLACAIILSCRMQKTRGANPTRARSGVALRAFAISASFACGALLALALFPIAGCGGASTVETAATITPTSPSQTYTIIVTPTATTSDSLPVPNVQPIQLTLVVN